MPGLERFKDLLVGVSSGRLTYDEARALVQYGKLEFDLGIALGDIEIRGSILKEEQVLIRLAWELLGSTRCLQYHFGTPRSIYQSFLEQRLRSAPGDFDGLSLQVIDHHWPSLCQLTSDIRIRGMKETATKVLKYGVELQKEMKAVQEQIQKYKFPEELDALLNKIDDELERGDQFDQAATIKHLRSFFEALIRLVAQELGRLRPDLKDGTPLDKCQQAIDFLAKSDLLKRPMSLLGRGIYSVLSEGGVHAISAEREYVRLCRNMVIEFALVLFFELARFDCD